MTLPHRLATVSSAILLMGAVGCSSEQASTGAKASPDASAGKINSQSRRKRSHPRPWKDAPPGMDQVLRTQNHQRRGAGKRNHDGGTQQPAHGHQVKVTRTDTGKSVTVVINDRKPFKPGTVIDLAHGSAVALDIDDDGTGPVQIEVLEQPEANPEPTR